MNEWKKLPLGLIIIAVIIFFVALAQINVLGPSIFFAFFCGGVPFN